MTVHDHVSLVPGCFRCELNLDEIRDELIDLFSGVGVLPRDSVAVALDKYVDARIAFDRAGR